MIINFNFYVFINIKFVEMLDKTTNSQEVPNLIDRHLLEQLKISKTGPCFLICNFMVFMTFNINYSHLCLCSITNEVYLIPSLFFLVFMFAFSFFLQLKLDNYISKSKDNYFCDILQKNFGSVSSLLFELLSLLWLGLYFMTTFISCKEYILSFISEEDLKTIIEWVYVIIFSIIILVFNAFNSSVMTDINIFISYVINIGIISLFVFTVIISRDKKFPIEKLTIKKFSDSKEYKNAFSQSFAIFTSGFTNSLIFFWINKKFKNSNLTVKHHRIFILINYIFNFLLYFAYIFDGLLNDCQKDQYYLTYLITQLKKKESNDKLYYTITNIIIALTIVYQLLLINFYFYVIKNVIFRHHKQVIFEKKYYFVWFSLFLVGLISITFWINNPFDIILFNNSTFGFIINFILPSKFFEFIL